MAVGGKHSQGGLLAPVFVACPYLAVVWKLLRLVSGDGDLEACVRKALGVLARDAAFSVPAVLKNLKAALEFSHAHPELPQLALNIRRGCVARTSTYCLGLCCRRKEGGGSHALMRSTGLPRSVASRALCWMAAGCLCFLFFVGAQRVVPVFRGVSTAHQGHQVHV
jgi:hypothetical protein